MPDQATEKRTYHLEMRSRDQFQPARKEFSELEIRLVEIPCPEFNWFLHQAVGVDFLWGGRENWDKEEWTQYVDRPELETWVAYMSGSPAGYYELERQPDSSVRIVCFGIISRWFGKGFGAHLLSEAIERAWVMNATYVWLTTCNHDHPHALKNYLSRGFQIAEETSSPPNRPRRSVLFTSNVVK